MDATRVRFAPLLEWVCAAAVIIGAAVAITEFVRDVGRVQVVPSTPVMAHAAPVPDPPAVVPARAVAVPILALRDGKTLRVGDRAADISATIGALAQRGGDAVERDGGVERVTRFYESSGTRFAVVLAPPRDGAEPLVVSLYRW
jgi:hypothetical protein